MTTSMIRDGFGLAVLVGLLTAINMWGGLLGT